MNENFVVSARKYRPADFASVVGQEHITSTLKNAIERGQLAHAYLFCGPRGVGKTTCARIFAKAINCLNPKGNEACGECESCKAFAEGRSFSIHELDAASNNSVDDIRSLTEQVRIPPQVGRYSVYIIDEVHMLSAAAFNAFLKTLEEPPAHAIFILATTEKHKILPTILSRCQIFDFNRIRVEDGVQYLRYIADKENIKADDESLHLIALKADGGMRDALSMFDKAVSFCGAELSIKEVARTLNVLDYDSYFNVAAQLLAGDYQSVLASFDAVVRAGFSPGLFAAGLNGHFRDLLMSKNPQTLPLLEVGGTLLERYKKQAEEFPPEFLFNAIGVLTAVDGTLRNATNQRLNVELGLMKIAGLGQKKNVEGAKPALPELGVRSEELGVQHHPEPPIQRHSERSEESLSENVVPRHSEPPTGGVESASEASPVRETASSEERLAALADSTPAPQAAQALNDAHITAPHTPQAAQALNDAPATQEGNSTLHTPHLTPNSSLLTPNSSLEKKSPILGGSSIGSLMNAGRSVHEAVGNGAGLGGLAAKGTAGAAENTPHSTLLTPNSFDPETGSKVDGARTTFLAELHKRRPRIAVAMEEMMVEGNAVKVSVPTQQLFEELMRERTEILTLLAEVAGVEGRLDLAVVVEEDNSVRAPIKVEDKLRFLTERNPALTALRKELNLELE